MGSREIALPCLELCPVRVKEDNPKSIHHNSNSPDDVLKGLLQGTRLWEMGLRLIGTITPYWVTKFKSYVSMVSIEQRRSLKDIYLMQARSYLHISRSYWHICICFPFLHLFCVFICWICVFHIDLALVAYLRAGCTQSRAYNFILDAYVCIHFHMYIEICNMYVSCIINTNIKLRCTCTCIIHWIILAAQKELILICLCSAQQKPSWCKQCVTTGCQTRRHFINTWYCSNINQLRARCHCN